VYNYMSTNTTIPTIPNIVTGLLTEYKPDRRETEKSKHILRDLDPR